MSYLRFQKYWLFVYCYILQKFTIRITTWYCYGPVNRNLRRYNKKVNPNNCFLSLSLSDSLFFLSLPSFFSLSSFFTIVNIANWAPSYLRLDDISYSSLPKLAYISVLKSIKLLQKHVEKIKLLLRLGDTFLVFWNIGVNWNEIKQARANRVRIKNTLSLFFHFLYYRVQSTLYNRVNTLSSNMLLFFHKSTITLLVMLSTIFPKWQDCVGV